MRRANVLRALALILLTAAPLGAAPADRLSRVGELSRALSGADESAGPIDPERAVEELFSLADGEIVDNLRSGEPFASTAFIQERLDAFTAAWGGASFRVHRLTWPGARAPLTVGVFTVSGAVPYGSVRAYGRAPSGEIGLIHTAQHEGLPGIRAWPAARDGAPQLLTVWRGDGQGARPVTAAVWRYSGRGLEEIWSTATPFPDGLSALAVTVTTGEIQLRYEARYPGWTPGCQGQTEHVDVFRASARSPVPVLASRRVVNGWHRDVQAAVTRLLSALDRGNPRTLAELVPDRALRARLPRSLVAEPACDQTDGTMPPTSVTVAATERRDGRLIPWSLAWRRSARAWRLAGAGPMLE